MAMAISARCSTARCIEVCSGAVSLSRSTSQRQNWRSAPPLRWLGPYISTTAFRPPASVADSSSGPVPGRSDHRQRVDRRNRAAITPAPRRRGGPPVPGCRPPTRPARRRTSRPPGPSSERAGTTALTTRWIGHECQQQGPPPPPPSGRQPRARHRQHRGQHGDPPGIVEELRQHRRQPLADIEMPARRGDSLTGDRQCQHGDESGRGVGAEQFPLPPGDQADQDDERQCHDRDAVGEVHQVRLGGGQHPDDPRDRPLQAHPVAAGDQRTGDHDRQEYPRQGQSEDVGGAPGQWLQQAAGDSLISRPSTRTLTNSVRRGRDSPAVPRRRPRSADWSWSGRRSAVATAVIR